MTKTTDIREVCNAEDLIGYFAAKLGWNIDVDSFESLDDFSYEFTADDLGLNTDVFAKIRTLRQLRPFDEHQKWGLFCIEFDSGKFEVSALRKVLSGLIPRKRKDPNAPVWNQNDILFLCDWGETANRTIGLAHFEEHEKGLPQIKTISCTPSSNMADPKELKTFEERLSGLAWPKNASDTKNWSAAWSSAFTTTYRGTIKRSAELTIELAHVAVDIRKRIIDIMSVENQYGHVHLLWQKFKNTLVADMTAEQFADMYAQTMVYGLFSARCMDKTPEDFSVEEAIDCIPSTNPFLKNLMSASMGARNTKSRLDFDELEIGNVVDLLLHADMTEIVKDFGRQSGGGREDPVLYFYEGFAKAYDAEKKIKCGEFYTPVPVVNFIVRAVDDILKRDFGYADGLATTATKKIKVKKAVYVKSTKMFKEKEIEEEVPAVQILDVATGTGTFLRQTILQIYENFKQKHAGTPPDALKLAWNVYVNQSLLPRINGFELNMAPYAVAHMKLAMALKDTGYDFRGNERLRVYLTNSLEEPGSTLAQPEFWEDPLAAESIAANAAKKNPGINIVIGNPPYSGVSQNNGPKCEWIDRLVDDYKLLDGIDIHEQKLRIRNDYIKFIRFGQHVLSKQTEGVLAYINPHAYLDGPTFRAMRWNLMREYDKIYLLNLHGNTTKRENAPDGGEDKNVFDIKEGVVINILVKTGHKKTAELGEVYYGDLYGTQDCKYKFLTSASLTSVRWIRLSPTADFYEFIPRFVEASEFYKSFPRIDQLMPVFTTGVQSSRDDLVVDAEREVLCSRISHFSDSSISDNAIREEYFGKRKSGKYLQGDTRGWRLTEARKKISGFDHNGHIKSFTYRPFDDRFIYYCKEMIDWGREKVFCNFNELNSALIVGRQGQAVGDMEWNVVFATDKIDDLNVFYRGGGCTFPLYLYEEFHGKVEKKPNFDPAIYAKICEAVGGKVTPEDVFHYIYAVLHTPEYRSKYKEFLKIDFPRIPYPKDAPSFRALAKIGEELVATHLLKSAAVTTAVEESSIAIYGGSGDNSVGKVKVEGEQRTVRVLINDAQGFGNVPEIAWNFYIGGYQPAQKWLKDRKGRTLSDADIAHYRQIIHALLETDRLMHELSVIAGTWM